MYAVIRRTRDQNQSRYSMHIPHFAIQDETIIRLLVALESKQSNYTLVHTHSLISLDVFRTVRLSSKFVNLVDIALH